MCELIIQHNFSNALLFLAYMYVFITLSLSAHGSFLLPISPLFISQSRPLLGGRSSIRGEQCMCSAAASTKRPKEQLLPRPDLLGYKVRFEQQIVDDFTSSHKLSIPVHDNVFQHRSRNRQSQWQWSRKLHQR